MPEKRRYIHADAMAVARELVEALRPVTERVIVAGSLRRGKNLVGDVEILFVPRFEKRRVDFFDDELGDLAEDAIRGMLHGGVLEMRINAIGGHSWGLKNKLAVHRASGIPVDLFTATRENWWNYLVCRTGPKESNEAICLAAQARGWKWNPYGAGFSRTVEGGRLLVHKVTSEREVFEFVGLIHREPEDR